MLLDQLLRRGDGVSEDDLDALNLPIRKAPATFGATIRRHLFPGVAVRCRIGLDKRISLLVVARCFWVVRAEWCQLRSLAY